MVSPYVDMAALIAALVAVEQYCFQRKLKVRLQPHSMLGNHMLFQVHMKGRYIAEQAPSQHNSLWLCRAGKPLTHWPFKSLSMKRIEVVRSQGAFPVRLRQSLYIWAIC